MKNHSGTRLDHLNSIAEPTEEERAELNRLKAENNSSSAPIPRRDILRTTAEGIVATAYLMGLKSCGSAVEKIEDKLFGEDDKNKPDWIHRTADSRANKQGKQ